MRQRADGLSCGNVRDLIELWVDGELGEAEAAEMKAHAGRCATCQAELELAHRMVSELRALPAYELPDRVARAARGRVRTSHWIGLGAAVERSAVMPLPVLAAVAAVVLAVVVVTLWRGSSRPHFSDHEVVRATTETKLALAYVVDATRRAERRVAHTVLDDGIAGRTMRRYRNTINAVKDPAAAVKEPPAASSQRTTNQGS